MKLPLYIQYDYYGATCVFDAEHKVVCRLSNYDTKFAQALVRKLNRNLRWRLFGIQPYVYTRANWLTQRNPCGNRTICVFNRGLGGKCLCKEHFENREGANVNA